MPKKAQASKLGLTSPILDLAVTKSSTYLRVSLPLRSTHGRLQSSKCVVLKANVLFRGHSQCTATGANRDPQQTLDHEEISFSSSTIHSNTSSKVLNLQKSASHPQLSMNRGTRHIPPPPQNLSFFSCHIPVKVGPHDSSPPP